MSEIQGIYTKSLGLFYCVTMSPNLFVLLDTIPATPWTMSQKLWTMSH